MSNLIGLNYIKVSNRGQFCVLFFNLYINDLDQQIPSTAKKNQHADDTHSYTQN